MLWPPIGHEGAIFDWFDGVDVVAQGRFRA
jgi:hypothetical protein